MRRRRKSAADRAERILWLIGIATPYARLMDALPTAMENSAPLNDVRLEAIRFALTLRSITEEDRAALSREWDRRVAQLSLQAAEDGRRREQQRYINAMIDRVANRATEWLT